MERSIAEAPDGARLPPQPRVGRAAAVVVGLLLALAALVLYTWSNPQHYNQYNHFVWQADAFLHGKVSFDWPVPDGTDRPANWYFQDVYPLFDANGQPTGQVLLPFPPLPALVLLPFVALFGLTADQEAIAVALAAIGVGVAWWMLGGLRIRLAVRVLTTILFATGTVWWWAAAVGSTWYLAHLVAVDRGPARRRGRPAPRPRAAAGGRRRGRPDPDDSRPTPRADDRSGGLWPLDGSQVLAGLLLGIAATARLPLVFAAPFFMLVGRRRLHGAPDPLGGGRRGGPGGRAPPLHVPHDGLLPAPGLRLPVPARGQRLPDARLSTRPGPSRTRATSRRTSGSCSGRCRSSPPRLKPNTLGFGDPVVLCATPDARRTLFDATCPLVMPIDIGTSILLSAPGLLLSLFAICRRPRARLTIGAGVTVILIALFNLAHFSQGWVQWGYRFSLDFIPFLLPLVALGAARADGRPARDRRRCS